MKKILRSKVPTNIKFKFYEESEVWNLTLDSRDVNMKMKCLEPKFWYVNLSNAWLSWCEDTEVFIEEEGQALLS